MNYNAALRRRNLASKEKLDPLLPVDMNGLTGKLLRGRPSYPGGSPNPTGANQWSTAAKAALRLRERSKR